MIVTTCLLWVADGSLPPVGAAASPAPAADGGITLRIDGTEVRAEPGPRLAGARVLVPVRVVAEGLGARVAWDAREGRVRLERDGTVADLRVGSREAALNGERVPLDAPAAIFAGRTFVPLRFVAEALGAEVRWDAATRTVAIARGVRTVAVQAQGGLAGRTIVIDPGHGGRDPGTMGPAGMEEKALTLAMARHLKAILEAAGARVVLTREDDRFVGLYERAAISDAAGADAFVSIHVNASDDRSIRGVETYHYPGAPRGKKLAGAVQRRLVEATGRRDRGVNAEDFVVVREPQAPAILVETGYITNRAEAAVIVTAGYRRRVAEGIARGIADFFGVGEL